ncbi:hypothetical protein LTR85_000069 [Meristemomyces frigidus]|nr:hypothetical protein LTR85_000069 [Meristemomyces frigidus]
MEPVKARGRPRKLLLAKNVAKKRCAIYDSNATSSPLLRLPPEIRNRIWRYVFGGNEVLIVSPDGSSGSIRHSLCHLDNTMQEEASLIRSDDQLIRHSHQARHQSCLDWTRPRRPALSLMALQACRQLHKEARLLPYHDNSFVFDSAAGLEAFIRALVPAQSQAIRSICAVDTMGPAQATLTTALLDVRLLHLEQLVVFFELNGGHREFSFKRNVDFRNRKAKAWLQFRRLQLTTVLVVPCRIENIFANKRVDPEMLELWAREVERALLEPYDRDGIARRQEEKRAERRRQSELDIERKERIRASGKLRTLER